MAMDGVEPKVLQETMELEVANLEEEAEQPIKFWQSAGGYSPTIGILGAVLGLIHVMENLRIPANWVGYRCSFCGNRLRSGIGEPCLSSHGRKTQTQIQSAAGCQRNHAGGRHFNP